jgi:hypothetical protein
MGGWLGQPLARRLRSVCGTVADGDGRFRLEGVPAAEGLDDLAWVASARTYSPAVEQAPPVADGHELRVELKLWAAGAVEGRVVDPNGRPLSGVRTAVKHWYSSYLPARSPFDGPEGVVTGPDGAFRIEAPSFPQGVHLTAARESGRRGFAGAGPFVVAAGATTAVPDLVMELRPAALLRVADLLDRPVAGALIEVPASRPEMRTFFTGADGRVLVSFERWGDGWQGVPAAVRISARGYVEQSVESFVPDSSDPPEVRVTLSRAAELRCHATWSDGSDAAGITVRVAAATAPIASIWPVRGEPPASTGAPSRIW